MPFSASRMLGITVLAIVAYCGLVFWGESEAVWAATQNLSLGSLLICLAWATANYVLRFVRWHFYLRVLGISVPLSSSAVVFVAGFAMSITPGKVGELLKSAMLKERYDVPIARSAPIVVAERVTDLAGLALMIAWGGFGYPGGVIIVGSATFVALAALLTCAVPALGMLMIRMLTVVPALRRREHRLVEAYAMLRTTSRPGVLLVATLLSFASWVTHGIVLWWLAPSLPGLVLDLPQSMFAYAGPLLAGTVAFLPGGLGVTEFSMVGILSVGSEGKLVAAATSAVILVRVLTFWWAIALGFAALGWWKLSRPSDGAAGKAVRA